MGKDVTSNGVSSDANISDRQRQTVRDRQRQTETDRQTYKDRQR